MGAIYYFVEAPHLAEGFPEWITAKQLADVGLSHLAEPSGSKLRVGKQIFQTPCAIGPDGKPGCIVFVKRSDAPEPTFFQYMPTHQTWIEAHGKWIGWPTDHPPTPDDLLRERPVPGAIATDSYGRPWSVPIARMPDSQFGGLSTYHSLGPNGKASIKLHAFESALWNLAESMAPRLMGEGDSVSAEDAIALAMLALGRNYQLSWLELAALEAIEQPLLDVGFVQSVAMAVCHFDFLMSIQKKTSTPPVG